MIEVIDNFLQIVHLKRFNYVSNKWVKSQKVVNFPFDNFDPTPYLASVPQETILRHKELLELKSKNIRNHDCDDEITEFDLENDIDAADKSESENNRVCDIIQENVEMDETDSTKSPTRSHLNLSKPSRRKRLVSTSLTKTPIVDGQFTDYNNHQLKPNADPFDLKYKLYAVVVSSHSYLISYHLISFYLLTHLIFCIFYSPIQECLMVVITSHMHQVQITNPGIASMTHRAVKFPINRALIRAALICCSMNVKILTTCHIYQKSKTNHRYSMDMSKCWKRTTMI